MSAPNSIQVFGWHDGQQADLRASKGDLLGLAVALERGQEQALKLPVAACSSYPRQLSMLLIRPKDSPRLNIEISQDALTLEGNVAHLELLASNIRALANESAGNGRHIHTEYHPGHYCLAEQAVPLIITSLQGP